MPFAIEHTATKKQSRRRAEGKSAFYFDEAREYLVRAASGAIPEGVETRMGSSVLRVPAALLGDEENSEESRSFRLMHIPFMTGFTRGETVLSAEVSNAQGALLAQQHFNRRSESVVPNLRELLTDDSGKDCDIKMTLDFYDTGGSPRIASELLSHHVYQRAFPYEASAVVGATQSAVSIPMAVLNTVKELPQVSYRSTSTVLNDRETYAMFGRTIPSTDGDARALIDYYRDLGVSHFGILYVQDEYGLSYRQSLERVAMRYGIHIRAVGINVDQSHSNRRDFRDGLVDGVKELQRTGYRYFVGIIYDQHMNDLIEKSSQAGIMGPGYLWLFGDGISESCLTSLQYPKGSVMAKALHGLGLIGKGVASRGGNRDRFKAALESEDTEEFRLYYASKTVSLRSS